MGTFSLVKSLTSTEKRKISFYLNIYNKSEIQLALFKILLKKNKYDAKKIAKELEKKVVYKSRYDVVELDLQASILKYLRLVNRNDKVSSQIREILDISEILIERGEYQLGKRIINKGVKLAEGIADHNFLYQLHSLNRNIERASTLLMKIDREEELLDQIQYHLKAIQEEEVYNFYYKKIHTLYMEAYILNKKENIEQISQILLLKIFDSTPISLNAKKFLYKSKVLQAYSVKDITTALSFQQKTISAIKEFPMFIEEDMYSYITLLEDTYSIHTQEKGDNELLFFEIESIFNNVRYKKLSIESARVQSAYYLTLFRRNKIFLSQEIIKDEAIEGLTNQYRSLFTEGILGSIYHEMSYYCFINSDFKKAHKWLSNLYIEGSDYDGHYSYVMATLNYLIHFELGNDDLLEKIRHRIIEQLSELKERSNFDKLLGDFFFSNKNVDEVLSNKTLLNDYIINMKSAIKNTTQSFILNDVNIIAWLISKRDGVSFLEALKKYNEES